MLAAADAQTPPGAARGAAPGWDIDNDALAHSLSWLTRHHGRERSAESLLAGQPLMGRLGPEQAVRVLREAGFSAGLVQRQISELHHLLLPAVAVAQLLLKRKPSST